MEQEQDKVEVFENDIAVYLSMFCEEQGIKEMKKESQAVWNAALMYIRRHVFKDKSVLKSSSPLQGYNNQNSNLNKSTCNSYNIDIVNDVCDYYIYLCMMYDKEVSQVGFSNLTGINQDTLIDWGNNINKLSTSACEIYKKLVRFREESLSNKLATGNKNPVGILAILNRHYAWNLPGVSREQGGKQALPDAQLPKLQNSSSNCITENNSINLIESQETK